MSLNIEEYPGSDLRALEVRNGFYPALCQRLFAFRRGIAKQLTYDLNFQRTNKQVFYVVNNDRKT